MEQPPTVPSARRLGAGEQASAARDGDRGPDPPLLSARALTVDFGTLRALDRVDLDIHRGEIVALVGENGAGKTTFVDCVAGDIAPSSGILTVDGRQLPLSGMAPNSVAVLHQDVQLADNLDVAENLMLGLEPGRLLGSHARIHSQAASMLERLGITLGAGGTDRPVRSLSGGQRQMLSLARVLHRQPRLLVLDEPTSSLGVSDSRWVEQLVVEMRRQGASVLLCSHDIAQVLRLADRIVVLRHGSVVAVMDPATTYADDVVAVMAGRQGDSAARRQLSRLHGLSDQLSSISPSSGLSLILDALSAALGVEAVCVHLLDRSELRIAECRHMPVRMRTTLDLVPLGREGGAIGLAAETGSPAMISDLPPDRDWGQQAGAGSAVTGETIGPVGSEPCWSEPCWSGPARGCWAVPLSGSGGPIGVLSAFPPENDPPAPDQVELLSLYAGYAASAIERDRLFGEATARNRVLETIRDMLEVLGRPLPPQKSFLAAAAALCQGLPADRVALAQAPSTEASDRQAVAISGLEWRACVDGEGNTGIELAPDAEKLVREVLGTVATDRPMRSSGPGLWRHAAVGFTVPGYSAALTASWRGPEPPTAAALLGDAARSLRLALEREQAEQASHEAEALRRSRELHRVFLSRLGHELRTPLTAIGGYASSLLQDDVEWDQPTRQRFLRRIASESGRLGRLVDDLLDFSAIETGILRILPDWCDLRLVIDAAVACLPPQLPPVEVCCDSGIPAIWADHDRLEQVFVNLVGNARRHNPPGTSVRVLARLTTDAERTHRRMPGSVIVRSRVLDDYMSSGSDHPLSVGVFRSEQATSATTGGTTVEIDVVDDGPGFGASTYAGMSARHEPELGLDRPENRGEVGPLHPPRQGSGAGLGLSISEGIVAAHGGTLERVAVPSGTCFRVRLPLESTG